MIELFEIDKINPHAYDHAEWAIDIRHVMILYNLLLVADFGRVLEIGTHMGASTAAFLKAQGKKGFQLHLCDLSFEPHIKKICANSATAEKIFLHECASAEYLADAPCFDFAFLDGSHIAEHVMNEFELLSMNGIDSILLHDHRTQLLSNFKDKPWFDGAYFLSERLRHSRNWYCVEDMGRRENELTDRGLFFATKRQDLCRLMRAIFVELSNVPYSQLRSLALPMTDACDNCRKGNHLKGVENV